MNGVNNESPQLICTNIFIKRKLLCTSLEWVLIYVSVFCIQSTFKSLCNHPLTVKSGSFLLQLDGKYEDCRTKKKHSNYYSLYEGRHRNRVLVRCFIWRFRHFYHGRYRYHVTIQVSGLVRIQKFNRDGRKDPPPSRRISIEISF